MFTPDKIRNIAIIAHIDHGKTTMIDALLKQAHLFRDNEVVPERIMDSNDQEKERGITIFAKNTSIPYKDYKINLIDTPGHADFSAEVERVLGTCDSVLLLIDAQEGPMPQTRFVLSKSLKLGLRPIVVINKIDRPHADPDRALNLTFDLFAELGADDAQLDFPYIYASGFNGYAIRHLGDQKKDMSPLLDFILEKVKPPVNAENEPFLLQVSHLTYDSFLGRGILGRVKQGVLKKNTRVNLLTEGKEPKSCTISRLKGVSGVVEVDIDEVGCGDIALLFGIEEVNIGDTICAPSITTALPPIKMNEPTVSVDILVNNSPFVGRDGKLVQFNKIKERLEKEKRNNITLKIDFKDKEDAITVAGRGELHLAVLMEQMRREGYEFTVSTPRVVEKVVDNVRCEPQERVFIELPEEFSGTIIEELSKRKAELQAMETNEHGLTSLQFLIPTRSLIGYRSDFLSHTKGLGILFTTFEKFIPKLEEFPRCRRGVLTSMALGKVTGYACFNLKDRGTLFVEPGDEVYEGMIVGEHARENDLAVNITREKKLTNVRAAGSDENIILPPARHITLEIAIGYIENDEWIEVTPSYIRLRKRS